LIHKMIQEFCNMVLSIILHSVSLTKMVPTTFYSKIVQYYSQNYEHPPPTNPKYLVWGGGIYTKMSKYYAKYLTETNIY